ncbi:MAG: serine/threonine protein kinase [Catenulisporales bacterium]|nr:serine/threonine protein kinase [Catenulisporales bacterium]
MTGWTVPGYTETASLGSGATGLVVSAVEDTTGMPVAIKYLSSRLSGDEAFLERFRAEAELLAGLEHPNVVRFHRYVETDDGAALVMELVAGSTLRRALKMAAPLTPEAALAVMRGSLLGLDAAHALGIVHRDYKPSNVLLTLDGDSKLADFGIAERAGTEMPALGTPAYMAPEQWEGAPALPVTDIYAVTASFYECLTGRVPFKADTVIELEELHRSAPIPLSEVPPAVRGLVAHGLAKDAGNRPANVAAFISEVEETAIAEYGVEWEEEGKRDLAAIVWPLSGSLGAGAGSAGRMAEGQGAALPGSGGDWFGGMAEEGSGAGPEEEKRAWKRAGRGTKTALAAAVVALLGSTIAAVAFGSGGSGSPPVAGSTGVTLSASSAALAETPSSTLAAGVTAPGSGTPKPTPTPTPTQPTSTSATSGTSSPTLSQSSSAKLSGPSSTAGLPSAPLSSVSSVPGSSAPSTSVSTSPTTSASTPSSTPTTTPSPKLTIVAQLESTCPAEAKSPVYVVTFTVRGLPAGSTVLITYNWHLVRATSTEGTGSVNAGPDPTSDELQGVPRTTRTQDSVVVDWNGNGQHGTTNSVPISNNCNPIP